MTTSPYSASPDAAAAARLAITMGDACGIGPEIVARWWVDQATPSAVVVGDPAVMTRAIHIPAVELANGYLIDAPVDAEYGPTQCVI